MIDLQRPESLAAFGWMFMFGSVLTTACGSVTVTRDDGLAGSSASSSLGGASSMGGVRASGGAASGGRAYGGAASGGTAVVSTAGAGSVLGGDGGHSGYGGIAGRAGSSSQPANGGAGLGGVANSGGAVVATGGTRATGGNANAGTPANTGGAASTAMAGAAGLGGIATTGGVSNTGGTVNVPVPAIAIATGDMHSCAVMSDHTIRCWGRSCEGQLGDGKAIDCTPNVIGIYQPVKVSNIDQATGIACGNYFSCAVLSSGKVQCWGTNYQGQLGNGTKVASLVPVDVTGITTARAVAASSRHACALLADGTVRCWGNGGLGQLGNGVNAISLTPTPVVVDRATATPLGQVQSIAGAPNAERTCAVQTGGSVYCWGENQYGELLGETETQSNVAIKAQGIQATAMSLGWHSTCALLVGGSVNCWGMGTSGELGNGLGTSSSSPVAVALAAPASALIQGFQHGCTISADSRRGLECWGNNGFGQLGDGSTIDRLAPVATKQLTQVMQVSAGYAHTCALLASGAVYCWGYNSEGQLGPNAPPNPGNIASPSPALVTGF